MKLARIVACKTKLAQVLQRIPSRQFAPLFLFAFLLLPAAAFGQASRIDGIAFNQAGRPAAASTVAVCSQPANVSTAPCSPLATLYTDSTATVACNGINGCSNPMTADGLGNYHFYYTAVPYTIQFYGSGLTTKYLPDQGISTSGNVPIYATSFPGSDPCLQLQAAENSLPTTGGWIIADFTGVLTACANTSVPVSISKPTKIEVAQATLNYSLAGTPLIQFTAGSDGSELRGGGLNSILENTLNCTNPASNSPIVQILGVSQVKVYNLHFLGTCSEGVDPTTGALIGVDVVNSGSSPSSDAEIAFNTFDSVNYGVYLRDNPVQPGAATNPSRSQIHNNKFVNLFGISAAKIGSVGILNVDGIFGHFDHNDFGTTGTPLDLHAIYLSLGSHHNEVDNNACYAGIVANANPPDCVSMNTGTTSYSLANGACVRTGGTTVCTLGTPNNSPQLPVLGGMASIGGITGTGFTGSFAISATGTGTFSFIQTGLGNATSGGTGTASFTDIYANNIHNNQMNGVGKTMANNRGISCTGACHNNIYAGNIIIGMGAWGILIQSASATIFPHDEVVSGNNIIRSFAQGIILTDCSNSSISSNDLVDTGFATDNTYNAISSSQSLATSSTGNIFSGNIATSTGGGPRNQYMFGFSSNTSGYWVTSNKSNNMGTGFLSDNATANSNLYCGNSATGASVGESCNLLTAGMLNVGVAGVATNAGDGAFSASATAGRIWLGSNGLDDLSYGTDVAGKFAFNVNGSVLQFPAVTDVAVARATSDALSNKTLNIPLTNGTAFQVFNSSTTCSTSGVIDNTCTTASITLPVAEADTNYRIACTGIGPTNIPVVETITKSNTTFTITIASLTAAVATFASYDCIVGHN